MTDAYGTRVSHAPVGCGYPEPFDRGFNAFVLDTARRCWPQGWDRTADASKAPSTLDELRTELATRGRITIWTGASTETIFGDPRVNFAFRAWHNFVHLLNSLDTSLKGEAAVAREQCRYVRRYVRDSERADFWCLLIKAEVVGQAYYKEATGDFPKDQRSFDLAYVLGVTFDPATIVRLLKS